MYCVDAVAVNVMISGSFVKNGNAVSVNDVQPVTAPVAGGHSGVMYTDRSSVFDCSVTP
jgi:hypothetical protein